MNAALTTGSGFNETLRQTELSKPSWLGPNAPASLALGNPLQGNMDRLKKRMGYHFVVKKAAYPNVNTGDSLDVSIAVENKGFSTSRSTGLLKSSCAAAGILWRDKPHLRT